MSSVALTVLRQRRVGEASSSVTSSRIASIIQCRGTDAGLHRLLLTCCHGDRVDFTVCGLMSRRPVDRPGDEERLPKFDLCCYGTAFRVRCPHDGTVHLLLAEDVESAAPAAAVTALSAAKVTTLPLT